MANSTETKADTLTRYEPYLDRWMSNVPMNKYEKNYHGRLATFRYIFHELAKRNGRVIVLELGTSRSFVDGSFPGCNSDDVKYWDPVDFSKWDFGAGMFTYLCAEFFSQYHPNIEQHTVDLQKSHIRRCKIMTRKFFHNIKYHVSDSVKFLEKFNTKCDLIYIDTGDMTPIEPTAKLQLEEVKKIVELNMLSSGGFLLIDDVRNPTALTQGEGNPLGKAKYSVPYLQSQGFRIVMDEYQMVLTKS